MGFLDLFRSPSPRSATEPGSKAGIGHLVRLAETQPKKALRQLRKAGATEYESFGVEGPDHDRYLAMYAELTDRSLPARPTLLVTLWSRWEYATNGRVISLARETDKDVIYLVAPRHQYAKSAAAEAEAVLTLANQPECPLVVLGEADLMVRTSFLVDVEALVPADAEDVIQDLVDAAAARSLSPQWVTI